MRVMSNYRSETASVYKLLPATGCHNCTTVSSCQRVLTMVAQIESLLFYRLVAGEA